MKVNILFFTLLILLLLTSSAMAIFSRGNINETYKYADLKIREIRGGTCLISGKIINKTNELKDGVFIKIYAFTIHDTFLWDELLFFSTIPAKGEAPFSERIYNCSEDNPYKLKFNVTG